MSIAFGILGSWHLAQDAVSEAFMRYLDHADAVEDAGAWLSVTTARLALDDAQSAARSRTDYVGPWLPDVVAVDDDPAARLEFDAALVRLLQTLSPKDRVVFVMREALGFSAPEIARHLGLTPAATRQRLARARKMMRAVPERPQAMEAAEVEELAGALAKGDVDRLIELLADGVVLWTDSAGHTKAARNPIYGAERVARFLLGIFRKYGLPRFHARAGATGAILVAESTDMQRWVCLETVGSAITGIQVQQTADKLIEGEAVER